MTPVVLDASAGYELLTGGADARWVAERIGSRHLVAPAHMKAEVLSVLGRECRAGSIPAADVEHALRELAVLAVESHELEKLLVSAWRRRDNIRLVDALYVELAAQLDTVVITTDRRLARATPFVVAPPPEVVDE